MRTLLITLLLAPMGCEKPAAPVDPTGTVSVTWDGVMKGALRATGEGRWCPTDSLVEVLAIDGDIGFGFSLLVPDSIRAVQYPVVAGSVSATWRPLGLAGLRWTSDTALKGYQAIGGNIIVTAADTGTVTGTVDLRLKLSQGNDLDTLRLTGSFSAIPVGPFTGACGRMSKLRGR